MRKRFSLPTLVGLVAASLLAGAMLNHVFSGDNLLDQVRKITDVLSVTEKYYVEDVDTQKLTEAAINGILGQLDPHSVYIPASQMQRVTEEFQGSFEGIGIEYQVLNDTLLVVAPIVGGPSEALGIQAGDKIVKINDSSAIGITQEGVQKKLQGEQSARVHCPRRNQLFAEFRHHQRYRPDLHRGRCLHGGRSNGVCDGHQVRGKDA
jgi:carboxyl-terminal processing protease